MKNIDYEKIYRYLNGEMDAAEAAAFEQVLEQDDELASEVAFNRDLLDSVEYTGDEALENKIRQTRERLDQDGFFAKGQEANDEVKSQGKPSGAIVRRLFRSRTLAVAASVLLLATVGFFLFRPDRVNQEVFASYYQFDQTELDQQLEELSLIGMATPDKARRESLKRGLDLAKEGSFSAAALELETHLDAFSADETAQFFLGLSKLETGDLPAAARQFEKIFTRENAVYQEQARWYLALTYLQMRGRQPEAEEILQQLAEDSSSKFQEEARALLQTLKEK